MKISNVIFCDDVRQEVANKFTLVGCYNDKLRITPKGEIKWPFKIRLGMYFRLLREANDIQVHKFKIEVLDAEESVLSVAGEVQDEVEQDRPMVFAFVVPFSFKRPGPLRAKIVVQDKKGKELTIEASLGFEVEVTKPDPTIV